MIFEDLDVAVTGFSYESREILTPFDGGIRAEGDAKYEILLVHGGDEKHLPIQKSLLEKSGFDYIAMGHIHKPQQVIPGLAAYAGALEPTDKNDTGKHGFIRGEISERGTRFEFVPLAKREYLHLVLETESRMGNAEGAGTDPGTDSGAWKRESLQIHSDGKEGSGYWNLIRVPRIDMGIFWNCG